MRLVLALLVVAACSKSAPKTTTTTTTTPTEPAATERPALTSAACAEQGGEVVGDIGDGAIHRADYRCASSGEPPFARIVDDPQQGPVAIEGAVCCKK